MNYEETLSTLKAIQASYAPVPFLANPETEPRFVIDSDTREIIIPEEFKFLAVKMDHMSEKIYFEIPRYFDDEDLATKICVIQYINTNGDVPIEAIVAAVDVDTESEVGKIIFRWDVDNYLTRYAGVVSFAIRFYTIGDDNRFTYSWNTLPATLPVLDTLDNTNDTVSQNYPTELVQWQFRMSELDRTISEKIADATESIDADTKAAQAARKGAEDAESRVNAIVAGNEAYTKKQSHDLFALALKGTAEAAKSITIYPDKGSNVVATINGFTKQEGSGDASPVNVRQILVSGRKLVKYVFKGTETFISRGAGGQGGYSYDYVPTPKAKTGTTASLVCSHYKNVSSGTDSMYVTNDGCIRFLGMTYSRVSDLKSHLTELYNIGRPVVIWYCPVDESISESKLFIPLFGTSKSHTGACGELTAPLCQGDKLITKVKSGCDKVITLTGANVRGASGNKVYFGTDSGGLIRDLPVLGSGFAICDHTFQFTNTTYWDGISTGKFSAGNEQIGVYDTVNTTKELAQEYYNAHPLTVWYRSTNYTEVADIQVSLEMHVQAVRVFNGTEVWQVGLNDTYLLNGTGIKPTGATATVNAVADYLKATSVNNTLSGTVGFAAGSQGGFQVYLPDGAAPAEYLPEHPLTAVYPLATPITYAHDPVDFIASPDEEGAWVITGEEDGTVSAEYNKNITKALEDILTRVSALELHALGG